MSNMPLSEALEHIQEALEALDPLNFTRRGEDSTVHWQTKMSVSGLAALSIVREATKSCSEALKVIIQGHGMRRIVQEGNFDVIIKQLVPDDQDFGPKLKHLLFLLDKERPDLVRGGDDSQDEGFAIVDDIEPCPDCGAHARRVGESVTCDECGHDFDDDCIRP